MRKALTKIGISIVVLAIALIFVSQLTIKSNMEDMLPKDSPYLRASRDFEQYFDAQEQAVILISNDKGLSQEQFDNKAIAYMDILSQKILEKHIVHSVLYKVDNKALKPYVWAYMEQEDFDDLVDVIHTKNPEWIREALTTFEEESALIEESQYFVSDDGAHYMMILKPVLDTSDFEASRMAFYNGMVDTMNTLGKDDNYQFLDVGMTGGAFIQDIEGDTVAFEGIDGTLVITLLLILVIVALFFGGLKLPFLSLYPLILGAISAAAAGFIIYGSINMFSVSFAMLLLGLGIDFAVHLIARYKEERNNGKQTEEAVGIASKSTGSSIVIGAVTTAFAFATFGVAQFRAFAQMGIISAVGIGLLCVSMLVLIPALILVFDKKSMKQHRFHLSFGWLEKTTAFIIRRKLLVVIVLVALSASLLASVMKTKIIGDVTAVYPDNIPSIHYADKLQEAFDYNSNTVSIYFEDLESLNVGVTALQEKDSVASVNSVLDYLPENTSERLEAIETVKPILEAMNIPLLDDMILQTPTYEVLPEVVKMNFVGAGGRLLAEIVPKYDIYDEAAGATLLKDVQDATGKTPIGMAVIMNEITGLVKEDTVMISILCLTAILIIALFAFRSIVYALLTLVPIGVSLYVTLGLLPILGIEVNLFSVASFPLIIGIGVDSSIHLLHRLKEDKDMAIPVLTKLTGQAIILTAVTTMIGFGSLSNINHPGMQNFGMVVVVGMAVNLLMTLTLIPIGMDLVRKFHNMTR